MLSPFRMVCRDFILPEGCKPCLLLSSFQFAKIIVPYRIKRQIDGELQKTVDSELAELARDVRNQVHKDYFLAGLLEQGIAYHIGYLPSAIRMRIEKLFKDEKITAMFCTSTLVEGVNLPADNLFITSYYSGRAQMTDVDFRNLIGRVGRIQYNLSGNVFLISDETRNNKQDVYLDKLKSGIPDQHSC